MSIKFVYGPSGSGKSTYIQNLIIERSMADPAHKYLLIVPDQFNMQTQVRMIELHPDHAFSGIEVLSFSRLSHRILEEVGGEDIPVLDDTGKNLIIRHVAGEVADSLEYMGSRLDRYGFISEVKSAISEFMQYGYRPGEVDELAVKAGERRILASKLRDIGAIYRAFMAYKADHYLTREETLDIVADGLHKSELVRDSVIVFDGFTGFTPIQEKVIRELMLLAREVIFSFTLPAEDDIYTARSEEDMFSLPSRSVLRLKKLAEDTEVGIDEPILCKPDASFRGKMLSHLESHIFRYPMVGYGGDHDGGIAVYKAPTIRDEIRDTFQRIRRLTVGSDMRYRDIAIVVGDMSAYADDIIHIADELDIPIYMDYSRSIMTTPFVEALSSAYDVLRSDYSCESVIRHMRTGFGPLDRSETDVLENFLLKTGIRGRASYDRVWTLRRDDREDITAEARDYYLAEYEHINSIREKVRDHFASLHNTDVTYTRALYDFLDKTGMYQKLEAMSERIRESGDISLGIEYAQIYDRIIGLLDQIESLCGDEIKDLEEFSGILEAGLSELKVGVIPQESDQIQVGDFVRTRLGYVKALFLLGANDCNIPGAVSTGGLISDVDRDFLTSLEDVELAPTPREQMFTQRFYLYMNMTKPVEQLNVSYVLTDSQGKDMQQSYLIGVLCKLFPELRPVYSNTTHTFAGRVMPADRPGIKTGAASMIREYTDGRLEKEDVHLLTAICRSMVEDGLKESVDSFLTMSRMHYESADIPEELVRKLYGEVIRASVSRLEKFAGCAYSHFLSYGLKLRTRPEFTFENSDMGDVFHRSLEEFAIRLREEGLTWDGLKDSDADEWVSEITDRITSTYGDTILVSSNRNQALSRRIRRVIRRSVDTIRFQVTQGSFVPEMFEKAFESERSVSDPGGTGRKYKLIGKIDRVDICEDDGKKYLRIVDYKSGNRDFDLTGLYHGFMLQLSVYMSEALRTVKGSIPAGMLYFHVSDPMVSMDSDVSDEDALNCVRSKMRMKGLVNDDEKVLALMDKDLRAGEPSAVIPVRFNKKDNRPDARSKACSAEDLDTIIKYAVYKSDDLVRRILSGDISAMPCTRERSDLPCKYCDYRSVCRIDSGIDGYESVRYKNASKEDLLDAMSEELSKDNG